MLFVLKLHLPGIHLCDSHSPVLGTFWVHLNNIKMFPYNMPQFSRH